MAQLGCYKLEEESKHSLKLKIIDTENQLIQESFDWKKLQIEKVNIHEDGVSMMAKILKYKNKICQKLTRIDTA